MPASIAALSKVLPAFQATTARQPFHVARPRCVGLVPAWGNGGRGQVRTRAVKRATMQSFWGFSMAAPRMAYGKPTKTTRGMRVNFLRAQSPYAFSTKSEDTPDTAPSALIHTGLDFARAGRFPDAIAAFSAEVCLALKRLAFF